MRLRLLGGAFALGMLFAPAESEAQTETQTAPEGASPSAQGTQGGTSPDPGDHGTSADPGAAATSPDATTTPDAATQDVPPVEVVQPKPEPQVRVKPRPRRTVRRAPPARPRPVQPEPALPSEITEPIPGYYGPPGGQGAFERAMESAQSPINPVSIIPGDLDDFSSAASRVTRQQIDEQEPLTTNDIAQRVPGVAVINDDGLGRHGGIGIRGSSPRRSRKVLVLEDGRSINQSLWLDPSSHYTPPPDRIEAVEVLRGTVIVHGPNNNHGVVNFRNLSPFGPNETVVTGQGGTVSLTGPGQDTSDASQWHTHTRQTAGNWGTVLSYSGANAQGVWDTERLRYNDFYAALGWKGTQSDFTLSAVYFRQRDNYDESNFEGDEDDPPGLVEREFFRDIKHCKTCFNPGSALNEYNSDVVLLQGVYNFYVNPDTTVTARVYGQLMDRARFFNIEGANPLAAEDDFAPVVIGDEVFVPEGTMEGRLRSYDHIGTELRTEFANRPFLFGLNQDVQVGVRYEHHEFSDRSFLGRQGQVLNNFDSGGFTIWERDLAADAFSAFLQTNIHVTQRLDVVPGVRLEHYRITRDTSVLTGEDEEGDPVDCQALFGEDECVVFEDFDDDPFSEDFEPTHVLPGVAFAYGIGRKESAVVDGLDSLTRAKAKPSYLTTLYGGYHRGLTMGVLREAPFPPGDELGDNFQIGLRSTALKGITFDVAAFHQRIQDYQFKSEISLAGDKTFGLLDEVEINGFEAYGRLDTRPYTGWRLNPYLEGTYTLADNVIERGFNADGESVAGNLVPEVPDEVAYLTAGIENPGRWNASVSWIYRGGFFTDEDNTPFGGDPEGEAGFVPSVWLLAARANYTIPSTNTTLFISGENLTDELYISDREDGIKPGLGRSVMAGARMRW